MKNTFNIKIIVLATIISLLSGCAGIEIGGRAGLYRVDEIQSSQKTHRSETKSLRCMLFDCNTKRNRFDDDVQGS